MDSPPSPPRPLNGLDRPSFFSNGSMNGTGDSARKQRTGRLFPPITAVSTNTSTTPSIPAPPRILVNEKPAEEEAYVWAEVKDRTRALVRYSSRERLGTTSGSSSASSSRSTSPASDDRRLREEMLPNGKAPLTPVPATPILKITRQQSFTKEKVIVGVRLRPLIQEDQRNTDNDAKQIVVSMKTDGPFASVQVQAKTGSLVFNFDHGFSSLNDDGTPKIGSEQTMVYRKLAQPLVQSMIAGVNCSFFAYGQTGTGKTYSTLGTNEDPGVVPRFCRALLEHIKTGIGERTWTLEISYFEIYNENIIDLFSVSRDRKKLRVREHPEDGPFVENLVSITVSNYADIEKWLQLGNLARHKASTVRNDGSSRSHAVFSLKLIQMTNVDGRPFVRKSKANFVDLAGSERLDSTSTSMSNADRMAETKNINKSLTHLGTVILQLASGKRTHISYRDSVLTWLLKDSLGGNAKTVMLATIAPLAAYAEETLSTLRYAANAYQIYNKTYVNEDPAIGLIEQLRKENDELKAALSNGGGTPKVTLTDDRIAALKARIAELESALQDKDAEVDQLREEYAAKQLKSNVEREDRAVDTDVNGTCGCYMFKLKIYLEIASKPALILLSPDGSLTEANVHIVDSLSSIIGRSPDCTISLCDGTTILDVQCSINWRDNRLFLYPRADAAIYVNGHPLQNGPTDIKELFDGDRVALGAGGEYFFGVSIPTNRAAAMTGINADKLQAEYWRAKAELLQMQVVWTREECNKVILQERQNQVRTLNEMTEYCKQIFGGVRQSIRDYKRPGNDDAGVS